MPGALNTASWGHRELGVDRLEGLGISLGFQCFDVALALGF